jgi:ABC-type glycerol-3-phosphate transport system permease component
MTALLIAVGAIVTLLWLSATGGFFLDLLRFVFRNLPKWWAILLLISIAAGIPLMVIYIALGIVSRYIVFALLWAITAVGLLVASIFNIGSVRSRLSRPPPSP